MRLKKILAMVLCVAMVLSTMSFTVFAETPEGTVATVNGVAYTDLQEAITAAAPAGVVDIQADITIEEWVMIAESLTIGNDDLITLVIDGMTINGNGHTLTINSIESAGNGGRLFYDATNLNINKLTIKYADGLDGAIGLKAGTIENVTFDGCTYGVIPQTGEVKIKDCTFKTNGTSIYFEEERDGLVVTGCTFENIATANVILLRGDVEFTNNTVISGRTVNVVSGSPVVTGNDFNDVRFKVYNAATATIENNDIAKIEIDDVNAAVNSTFTNNTLSEEAETVLKDAGVLPDEEEISVAKIGNTGYVSLAKALEAAKDEDTVTLIWKDGDAPIAMNGAVYGKTVTITGTASVDWSKGFLFVGRGGEGNGTVIFENAELTSASNQASTGIHVSGREKGTTNKYDGTVILKDSNIELDYLINKGNMSLDNSTLTVKNGFSVGGRPASETESGADATATLNLNNGSKVVVHNHNGMGLGYEAIGIMNVNSGSTFECTQDFLITAKGTMNVNGGNVIINGKLTNLGIDTTFKNATVKINTLDNDAALFIEGTNTIQIEDVSGSSYAVRVRDGAVFNDSYMPGTANETVRLLGSATFNGGFKCSYLQGSSAGEGGTVTIEDGTVVEASYGVEFSKDYTLNGGTIELSGGNASKEFWGCVFQSGTYDINTDIVVDGNGDTAPIHFTKATATVNGSVTQSKTGGEPIYIGAGSTVSFGDEAVITTDCSVHVSGTLKSSGDVNGKITKAADNAIIEVSGGTYTQDVSDWCVAGYECKKNEDGTYGVIVEKKNYAAEADGVTYETIAEAIKNAENEVIIYAGDYTGGLTVNKAITVKGETDANGKNLVNISGKLSITADGAKVQNININNGSDTAGYISAKDVVIEGCSVVGGNGFRWCYTDGLTTFKDCTITGSTYGIHFDGECNGEVKIDNCVITGWTSFASTITKVTISDSEFAEGNYNQLRFYQDSEITDTEFNPDMNVDFGKDAVVCDIKNCTVTDGSPITDVIYLGDIAEMGVKVTVDDAPVQVAASVTSGEDTTYYLTLQEAINAAQAGDTVTIKSGTYEVPSMKAGITVVGEGEVLLEGTLSGTLENLTLKNLHIKGGNAQRWAYAKGDCVFENVTFEATSVYALHFDGITSGATLLYKDCTIIGWAAMSGSPASVVFDGCTIKDNGTYGLIRTYFDAEIKNCTFDVDGANTEDVYQEGIHAVAGAKIEVDNCTNANGDMKDVLNISGNSKIYLDGKLVLYPVATVGETYYSSLQKAIDAAKDGDTVAIIAEGTYALPSVNKKITIEGYDKEKVVFNFVGKAYNALAGVTDITFKNCTINKTGDGYSGFFHSTKETYDNCVINGEWWTYATDAVFTECTLNQTNSGSYNLWTYGSSRVTLDRCTLNSAGKSVLLYNEGTVKATELTVIDTDFFASEAVSGKAAIEIDTSLMSGTSKVSIDELTTATGFAAGNVSGNTLWNVKKDKTNIEVTVNDVQVWPLAPVASGKVAYRAYVTDTESREAVQVDLENVKASESVVVKLLDENNNLLTTSTYKAGAYEGSAMTCNIVLWGDPSSSWETVVADGVEFTVNNAPYFIELWIDGAKLDTFENAMGDKLEAYKALDCVCDIMVTYSDGTVEYFSDMLEAVPYKTNYPKLEGATITLLADVSGSGLRFMENDMVFDLNGFTYTITAGTGSQGTNTSGFQIRPEVTTDVLFKNGTIKVMSGAPVVWMFNCYATDFIVENVTVDCANMAYSYGESCYVAVSRAEDNVQFEGNTKVINFNSEVAGNAYSIGGTMEVDDSVELGGTVLLSADATLKAREGLGVVTEDGYQVVYENGTYSVEAIAYVAQIGDVKYESLAKAFATAKAGDVITLLEDVTLDEMLTVDADDNIVLDLNGKKIDAGSDTTRTDGGHLYAFTNYGTLTVKDSVGTGEINARGNFNYGVMTLENGTINAIDGNGGYGVRNYENASFTLDGGKIATTYEDDNKVNEGGYDATPVRVDNGASFVMNNGEIVNVCDFTMGIENRGTTTIKGGTVTSIHTTIANYNHMEISGGIFVNNGIEGITAHALWAAAGTTTITGGTFNGKDNYNGFNVDASEGAVVNISGGNFLNVHSGSLYGDGTISVSGGTFFDKISENRVAKGYKVVANEDGTYGVVAAPEEDGIMDKMLVIWNMGTKTENGIKYYPIHIYSGIDSLKYKEVGFKVVATNMETGYSVNLELPTTVVYRSMKVTEDDGSVERYVASALGDKCAYMFGDELKFGVDNEWTSENTKIQVTPYAIDLKGNEILGTTKVITNEVVLGLEPDKPLFEEEK